MKDSIESALASCPREDIAAAVKDLEQGYEGENKRVTALPPWLVTLGPIILQILKDFLGKSA